MNAAIFSLTIREFFSQRRSLIMFALAIVPILLAIIYRVGDHADQHDWTANVLLDGLLVTTALPLACLILGTSALGSEIEDGSAVYILAKPIPRSHIIAAKFAAGALVAAMFIVPSTAISGLIALQGAAESGLVIGFTISIAIGIAAYTGLFVLLSVITSRALLIGLGYVFVWEGIATNLFTGTRFLSIRHYCLGIADLFSSADKRDFEAELGGAEAVVLTAIVIAAALFLAVRRLESFELTATD